MTAHREIYAAIFGEPGPGFETGENERLAIGDWRFFHRRHGAHPGPGGARDLAAVNGGGLVVSPTHKDSWRALLATGGMTAKHALACVAWLYRSGGLTEAERRVIRDERASAMVGDPTLETRDDGAVVFRGWTITPPNMSHPMLTVIEAPVEGAASVTITAWTKLATAD